MKRHSLKRVLLGTTLLAISGASVALLSAAPALAQEGPAAASSDDVVIVTGTRIVREGYTSASPVATVDASELEKQQPTNVETVLRQMPQFLPSLGSVVNNGSAGVATIDLRGLTAPRTLPLIDGHRMVGYDPNGQFDVTSVPVALLKRVDVVTGGASAVYGSDAIAGVVNFILNDDFQGVQLDGNYSITGHGDGETDNYSLTTGAGFDDGRGNVVLNLGYTNREPVYQTRFPASATPGGSSFTTPPYIDGIAGKPQIQADGSLAPTAAGGTGTVVPLKTFDYNPYNLYQTPNTKWNATVLAKYKFTDHIEGYSHFIYQNSSSNAILAPSLLQDNTLEIPLSNPFLTPQASNYLATNGTVTTCSDPTLGQCVSSPTRWRALAVGPRTYVFNYDTFQALAGLRGDFDVFGSNWKWDVAAAHGETNLKRQQNNDFSSVALQQAIFTTSATTCNGAGADAACVPLNFFNPSAPVDPAAISFIALNLQLQAVTKQDYVTGSISGDLGKLKSPLATNPIGVSFGMEYRGESTNYQPDNASIKGISPGFGGTLPVKGRYDTTEEFVEALVPVVEDKPFIKAINLELGFRNSNYSTSGVTHSYKYGADYSPIEGLRFRGMFDRAVRAANLSELYSPVVGLATADAATDPCAAGPTVVTGSLYNLCAATGVPTAVLNSNSLDEPTEGQVGANIGGSPTLTPEVADTWTVGLVWQPEFIHGLGVTLDYYDIKIGNAISVRPAQDILNGCYDPSRNTAMDASFADCQLLHRNPSNGMFNGDAPIGIDQINQNIAQVRAKGIDYSISYQMDLPGAWGGLSFSLDGTHVDEASYVPAPAVGTIECAGYYGKACGIPSTQTSSTGGPTPKDHFVQRTTWDFTALNQGFEVSYLWRHLSSVDIVPSEAASSGPPSNHIGAYDYLDLAGAWNITGSTKLKLGVVNVFDKKAPEVDTSTGSTPYNSGNTYPSTYDVLGRIFQVGITQKF
ncbi:MAG: TonB-dependent receptor [Alphaproteobacteria bacterium]|nr:TonB-dependent receptor [Alphaproteobacteria bacterium]